MDGSISLQDAERKTLMDYYRRHADPAVRLRAPILLLLAAGHTWSLISVMLFGSTATISRCKHRFEEGGVDGVLGRCRGRPPWFGAEWASMVVGWVSDHTPRDFGFFRSRWCCRVVVVMLLDLHQVKVSEETVRRWLHRSDYVWRRPRPVLKRQDPERAAKLRKLRKLLAHLPDDEIAVFQDEVDINTNPEIGAMWMPRGEQAEVETPGNNEKRYLAGWPCFSRKASNGKAVIRNW